MLNDGATDEEVANLFGMSTSSVKLLKYSKVKNNTERIKCEICGKFFKQITIKHLENHHISLDEYKDQYPNVKTVTDFRLDKYRSFKHPNKGKTYKEIYGEQASLEKRKKISTAQIGRSAPLLAGTGITGVRKDTGYFARSTYEANIDRIFAFENKRSHGEFSEYNKRQKLVKKDGSIVTYQPDRIDIDGLFYKGAYLEIKGYMYPEDWEKIQLFREQYPDKKLLIISEDKKYLDIDYKELEAKYKKQIPLWEGESQNYKKNPEIYKVGYVAPNIVRYYEENYSHNIINSIQNNHMVFIAQKCISYCRVRLGKQVYVDGVSLICISDKRPLSRKSTGRYNFELWEVVTHDNGKYYVTNQEKTNLFYCYEENKLDVLKIFFENNNNQSLKFGRKKEMDFSAIDRELMENFERKDILTTIQEILEHRSISQKVVGVSLMNKKETRNTAKNDREEWLVETSDPEIKYKLTNAHRDTSVYKLIKMF